MRAYLPLKRRSNIANPKVAISQTNQPALRVLLYGQKIVFVYGIRNTTEFGYRITDLGSRISSGCRMPEIPRPQSTPHGIPCRWAVGAFLFWDAVLLRNSDIGYNIMGSVSDIGDPDVGFLPTRLYSARHSSPIAAAGWRADGMRKLER